MLNPFQQGAPPIVLLFQGDHFVLLPPALLSQVVVSCPPRSHDRQRSHREGDARGQDKPQIGVPGRSSHRRIRLNRWNALPGLRMPILTVFLKR